MGKPHPMALRERVVAFVGEGHSHRVADARFRVSVKFVNDIMMLKRETGGLEPRAQGNGGGHGKLGRLEDWKAARMAAKPDLTLDDLVLEIADEHQMTVHRVSVWRTLRSLGLTHKKTSRPSSKSGLRSGRRAIPGSRDASRSCITCSPTSDVLTRLP